MKYLCVALACASLLIAGVCFAMCGVCESPAAKGKVVNVDRNNNGKIDGEDSYNDEGKLVKKGYDDDENGVMDRWQDYDPNTGLPSVVESDTRGELR